MRTNGVCEKCGKAKAQGARRLCRDCWKQSLPPLPMLACATCGKTFRANSTLQASRERAYCSRKCGPAGHLTGKLYRVQCRNCGSGFESQDWRTSYCEHCHIASCLFCGETFERRGGRATGATSFCSLGCRSRYKSQQLSEEVPCRNCGKLVLRSKKHKEQHSGAFCGRECRTTYFWRDPEHRRRVVESLKKSPSVHSEQRLAHLAKIRKMCRTGPDTRDKIRKARMRQHFPTKMTSIEAAVKEWLEKMGIPFTKFGRKAPAFRHGDISP